MRAPRDRAGGQPQRGLCRRRAPWASAPWGRAECRLVQAPGALLTNSCGARVRPSSACQPRDNQGTGTAALLGSLCSFPAR